MKVKVFNTGTQLDPVELNAFLAENNRTVRILRIHTTSAKNRYGADHFVTVEYTSIEEDRLITNKSGKVSVVSKTGEVIAEQG